MYVDGGSGIESPRYHIMNTIKWLCYVMDDFLWVGSNDKNIQVGPGSWTFWISLDTIHPRPTNNSLGRRFQGGAHPSSTHSIIDESSHIIIYLLSRWWVRRQIFNATPLPLHYPNAQELPTRYISLEVAPNCHSL